MVAFMVLDALKHLHPAVYRENEFVLLLDAAEEVMAEDFATLARQRLSSNVAGSSSSSSSAVNDITKTTTTNTTTTARHQGAVTVAALVYEAGLVRKLDANTATKNIKEEGDAGGSGGSLGGGGGGGGGEGDDGSQPRDCKVVIGRKGRSVCKLVADGIEGHAGNAHQTSRNAITVMSDAILQLSALTDYDNSVTVNVGTISGGTTVNTVPGTASADFEMRAASAAAFERANAAIEEVCNSIPHLSLERIVTVPPWDPNDNDDDDDSNESGRADIAGCDSGVARSSTISTKCVRSVPDLVGIFSAAGSALGLNVVTEVRGGGSDANWLSGERYPVLDGLGPSGHNAHCCKPGAEGDGSAQQEYAEWESFALKAALSAEAILRLLERS